MNNEELRCKTAEAVLFSYLLFILPVLTQKQRIRRQKTAAFIIFYNLLAKSGNLIQKTHKIQFLPVQFVYFCAQLLKFDTKRYIIYIVYYFAEIKS